MIIRAEHSLRLNFGLKLSVFWMPGGGVDFKPIRYTTFCGRKALFTLRNGGNVGDLRVRPKYFVINSIYITLMNVFPFHLNCSTPRPRGVLNLHCDTTAGGTWTH